MTTTARPSPLSAFRFLQGLTQAQLAERAQCARETVSRLERGAKPQAATAEALSRALGQDPALLFPNDAGQAGNLAGSKLAGGAATDEP